MVKKRILMNNTEIKLFIESEKNSKNIFSCYIIGDNSITLQCANIVLNSGHTLLGVISPVEKIKLWCIENSINYIEDVKEFEKNHKGENFDFLFSIDNSEILSKEILSFPRFYSINYHNSPLPKYAGLHATSWAIINNEKQHAITWHIMDETLDTGDILKQPFFNIESYDTAFSLNLKCYEKAIYSFQELIDELSTERVVRVKQNLSYRSYFGLKDIPPNGGFISWNQSLDKIDQLCRALTLGDYKNQLSLPKIIINREIFILKSYKKLDISSNTKPGKVVNISDESLQVSTATFDIDILDIADIYGNRWSIKDIVTKFKLNNDSQLNEIKEEQLEFISNSLLKKPKIEKYWVSKLITSFMEEESFLSKILESVDDKELFSESNKKIKVSKKILKTIKGISKEKFSLNNFFLTIILFYLFRLNNYKNMSVEFSNTELKEHAVKLNYFISDYVPLITTFDSSMTLFDGMYLLSKEMDNISKNKTYIRDIFARYPELKNKLHDIQVRIIFCDSKEEIFDGDNKKLNIYIANDCSWFYFNTVLKDPKKFKCYSYLIEMNKNFLVFLDDITNNTNKKIYDYEIINKKDKKNLMLSWNNTNFKYNYKKPIHKYFEEQARKTPDAIAIIFEDKSMSYKILNEESNKLAHYLKSCEIKIDSLVGISLNRSLDMVICILAILKADCAYLPLDPNYPDDRILYMLKNSKSDWLLMDKESINNKPYGYNGNIINVSEIFSLNLPKTNLKSCVKTPGLAYVIYTSGTTGNPKGVAISHRSVCNHMIWMHKEFKFNKDIFLQKTPFSFDASVWEFFMPLLFGGKLIIAQNDAHASPIEMIRLIKLNKVSVLQLVPSMFKELLNIESFSSCDSLKYIFCGGESLLPETMNIFFKKNIHNIKLYNLYGPTEATIDSVFHRCDVKDDISLIGKPIMNTKVYVLDSKLQPVPIGVVGELYIAGEGLANGYLHDLEHTKQKFLKNPFSDNKDSRLYKTGDLVRWRSDGNIEYLSRIDTQIKIRGFRIEINEIESNLIKINAISQCIVTPGVNDNGSINLLAYIVLEKNLEISAVDIRDTLKRTLPEYMIPSKFFIVDKLLVTPNGKIDRKNLPTPKRQLSLLNNYIKAKTETEKILNKIWCSVLKIKKIGIHDNFFELGGNSLSAMQIISYIRNQCLINLSIKKIFDFSTIHTLAIEIEHQKNLLINYDPKQKLIDNFIINLKSSGEKTPLFLVHPIGGSVFWYKYLAKYIDKDQPLYGIQDPALDSNEFILDSLEEMANTYIKAVKVIQPYGPYLLGGASFGTTVAVEMARQLEAKGEIVSVIISFDGWASYPSLQNDEIYFRKAMEDQNSRLLKRYIENNALNPNFLLDLQWHREKMLTKYKLPIIQTKLVLFKATELSDMFKYSDAEFNWWENHTSQPIELHLIPGDHESIFYEPNIKTLANKLNYSLSEKILNVVN